MRNSWLVIIFSICIFSCGIDSSRKKKDRLSLIEELTRVKTDSIRIELDSICIETKEIEFDRLVDSTLQVRLADIRKRLKEYHK